MNRRIAVLRVRHPIDFLGEGVSHLVVWIRRRTPLSGETLRERGFPPTSVPADLEPSVPGRGFAVIGR